MRYKRIVDLSQPIIHGGGFGRPAQITYSDHRSRGKALADQLGIDPTRRESGRGDTWKAIVLPVSGGCVSWNG
jgi:hypothetical protein